MLDKNIKRMQKSETRDHTFFIYKARIYLYYSDYYILCKIRLIKQTFVPAPFLSLSLPLSDHNLSAFYPI